VKMIRLKFSHFQKKYFLINEISKRGTTANKQISAIPILRFKQKARLTFFNLREIKLSVLSKVIDALPGQNM